MKKVTFRDFIHELEVEAKAEGPEAVKELKAFREYFRLVRKGLRKSEITSG